MPLPKRCVEPVHVSRGTVPERLAVPSELEAVTNGTLANTVRQLSSLSKHAEDMFGELTREATGLAERTNVLQARIDRLAIKVTQLDSGVEEVSLQDIQMRKAFRSSRTFQQQLFSRSTMPSAMLATYARCDRPPPLERLNEFRDDGRDARKFYTDPDYFFELWRREMLQDTERIQHGKKVRPARGGADGRAGRRVRAPHSTREKQKAAAVTRGEHIMAPSQLRHYNIEPAPAPAPQPAALYRADSLYQPTSVPDGGYRVSQNRQSSNQPARPNSIEIENQQNRQPRITGNGHVFSPVMSEESPYGPAEPIYGNSGAGTPRRPRPSVPPPAPPAPAAPPADAPPAHTPTRCTLPPPPPPPDGAPLSPPPLVNGASPPHHQHRSALDAHLDHMHAVIGMMSEEPGTCSPPPPPPAPPAPPAPPSPPAAGPGADDRPRPPSPGALARGASALKPPRPPAEPQPDPRSDLLKAIRDGIKLRKVEKRCDENTGRYDTLRSAPALHDVASILARRVAVELSDTSSGADSDSDDSEQWTESRA
ncbi:actin-binding protein WASF2 [Galleria mellonella]|uniref:Wiskott-Aldrich syndrome protein family member n=1 Tax=Galleria mellonella TaxID=7137 RepID=A0ABM3MIW5_GALME|nr:actin-binding protein WASF2 [Galleria mellonella]XP_052751087.1 actin-binding protein WASF2 [Galleria mellonella]XP_052751088.1 actin-binding protein WASF2 [Galleria mellonella]XP_052751089.1 actin-binding protein WASF2 [Galleria mellonella]